MLTPVFKNRPPRKKTCTAYKMKVYNPTINNNKKQQQQQQQFQLFPPTQPSNLPKYQHPNFVIVSVPDWLPVVVLKLPHWPPNPPLKRCRGEGPVEPEVFSWVFVGGCAVVVKEKALQKCTGSLAEFFCGWDMMIWWEKWMVFFWNYGRKPFLDLDLRGGGECFYKKCSWL